jgi:hypothetical protein
MDLNHEDTKPVALHIANISDEKQPKLVDAAQAFLYDAPATTYTLLEEMALLKKIDWTITPLLAAVYFLQFVDKNLSKLFPLF